jgi:hypothetical protein
MPDLTELDLSENSLNYISKNMFSNISSHTSVIPIRINLSNNKLNGSSFEIGAFSNFISPVSLTISVKTSDTNNITYLDQRVFQPFIDKRHLVPVGDNVKFVGENYFQMAPTLDCDDCRNCWLHQEKYKTKELCSNHKKLDDSSNFKKCVH